MINKLLLLFCFFCVAFSAIIPIIINPIIVLFYLLVFIISIFFLLLVLQIQYLAFTVLMIYCGAILILFVFLALVMLKDISLDLSFFFIPDYIFIIFYILLSYYFSYCVSDIFKIFIKFKTIKIINLSDFFFDQGLNTFIYQYKFNINDIYTISFLLYTKYFYFLLSIFILLFFSMINSISLIKSFFNPKKKIFKNKNAY